MTDSDTVINEVLVVFEFSGRKWRRSGRREQAEQTEQTEQGHQMGRADSITQCKQTQFAFSKQKFKFSRARQT